MANVAPQPSESTHRCLNTAEVFSLRCWARAKLYSEDFLTLHQAVDELQEWAEKLGFIEELGQDEIQSLMAAEFGAAR